MLTYILSSLTISRVLLGTITALSLYWLWTRARRPYFKYNVPPFPEPPLPIVGHFFKVGLDFRDRCKQWRKTVGDIFALDIGGTLHIVVNGYDNIKDVLVKNADHVPNAEHFHYEDILDEYDTGIITARDENWKEQRTVSLAILRHFGMGKNLMAQKIQEEVFVYIDKLADLQGRPCDFSVLTNVSVANVICAIIVGTRFEHENPYFQRFIGLNDDLVKYINGLVLVTAFPFLYYLPGDLFMVKKWIKSAAELNDKFSKKYIQKFKESYNENEEPSNFISAYLQEMRKRNGQGTPTRLDEKSLVVIIRTLFLAGTETTSTTILWCVLYLLHNPEVQEKVYREIEEHVGIERSPNISDKPKLLYLNAAIMETQRMASLVAVGLRREVSSQFEVGGYTFPKGSVVWPVLDSVMYDENLWGNPQTFRPERFLDSNGTLMNPEQLIPFSMGRRMCLGEGLAKMELFLFLSNMIQRFKFEPADNPGKLPSTEGSFGATVKPHPYHVRFINSFHASMFSTFLPGHYFL